jgi:glutamate-1-semialdehyde 2,1-aminomutase
LKQVASAGLLKEARAVTPGGVQSSIRGFDPVLHFTRARGSRLTDADGNEYIDYHGAFGPIILGHGDPHVTSRVSEALNTIDLVGSGFTEGEVRLCQKIVASVPSADQVLLTNSGSEATYHAIRVARAVTGRVKIIKFEGSYHGWHDAVGVNVNTSARQFGRRTQLSAGTLAATIAETLVARFNELDTVERLFREFPGQIAAVIAEPIQHGVGAILPRVGFLEDLRRLTAEAGSVLIFDEIITGFRHALGGYQAICGVTPDLTTLGKAMANGFPISAIAGRTEIMEHFNTAPPGDVYFAGTFNGHPVSTAAALATIERLEEPGAYDRLYQMGEAMRAGLRRITQGLPFPTAVAGVGSVYLLYFMERPPETYADLFQNDSELFLEYRQGLIQRGIFEVPMDLKRNHISLAHSREDIDRCLTAAEDVLRGMAYGSRGA